MEFLVKKWSETSINRSKKTASETKEKKNNIEKDVNHTNSKILKINTNSDYLSSIKNYNDKLVQLTEEIEKINIPVRLGKKTVIGRGDFKSPVMFIGEAPGEEENKKGVPFVGASGKLIGKMLEIIGIKEEDIYIINMFFWQPENNRTPTLEELELTKPYVLEHIKIQNPKLIVTLGSVATKTLLNSKSNITSLRGGFQEFSIDNNMYYDLFVTFHPAYILRNGTNLNLYKQDFEKIKTYLIDNNLLDKIYS